MALRRGMVGGGRGPQIGGPHRVAAQMDGLFRLEAGAFDVDAEPGRAFAAEIGVAPDRAYGTWQDMLEGEKDSADRIDLVTIATPNDTHFAIANAFLAEGFHILCE